MKTTRIVDTGPILVTGRPRVVIQCVNELTPKRSSKLTGYDVYIWDQCYAMEQSLRIDEQ